MGDTHQAGQVLQGLLRTSHTLVPSSYSMIDIKNHPVKSRSVFFTQKFLGAEPSSAAHHLEWNQLTAEEDLAHDFVRITYHIDQSFY